MVHLSALCAALIRFTYGIPPFNFAACNSLESPLTNGQDENMNSELPRKGSAPSLRIPLVTIELPVL